MWLSQLYLFKISAFLFARLFACYCLLNTPANDCNDDDDDYYRHVKVNADVKNIGVVYGFVVVVVFLMHK